MFCWQARRKMAGYLDRSGAAGERLEAHLSACPGCRLELEEAARVSELVGEAGRVRRPVLTPAESERFERDVMRAIRSRRIVPGAEPSRGWLGPVPIAAAASLMLLAAVAALLSGSPASLETVALVDPVSSGEVSEGAGAGSDLLVAPREIPFTYVEDLVGARRGQIPLTTYVLEPAPDDKPVVRASL